MDESDPKFKNAQSDPTNVFVSPQNVVDDDDFTKEQKVKILKSWEFEARELEIAEDESMCEASPDVLDEILEALKKVDG